MSAPPQPPPPFPKSGAATVLQYSGIPPSWLNKRPKLPSRNWLIFISVVSSLTYLYVDDRRKCKAIRQDYIERVKHLADEGLGPLDLPRKVTVYAARSPGDDDHDRSMRHFRKYVKPILVAAAVDFECVNGPRHGILTQYVADKVKSQRRLDVGMDSLPAQLIPPPIKKSPEYMKQREFEGGIILIGRHTFKEYMEGLKRGWTESMVKIDREEELARELEMDGVFDEKIEDLIPTEMSTLTEPTMNTSTIGSLPKPALFTPFPLRTIPNNHPKSLQKLTPAQLEPPSAIPPQPPLLLVPFKNLVGFKLVPHMILGFFYQREKVREGAESAYKLVMGRTRDFQVPQMSDGQASLSPVASSSWTSDLDFDRIAEDYYKNSFEKMPGDVATLKRDYYEALTPKIVTARALARREREPTKEEITYPPPTEVELRAERLKREMKWRTDLDGWDTVRKSKEVAWHELFKDSLRVYVDPSSSEDFKN